jgi:hypothetical protein
MVSMQAPDELLELEALLVADEVALDDVVLAADDAVLVVDEVVLALAVPPIPPPLLLVVVLPALEAPPVPLVSCRPLSPETSWQPPARTSAANASVVVLPCVALIVSPP